MRAAQIRQKFLEFFREHDHEVVPSSPVVPHDDPTLLFANAGMNQFKAVFTGAENRSYTRATSTQKCIRAGGKHNDLDNVGYTARHLTFFEMLGNFSFGDYFKSDACRYAWDLVTSGFALDADRLWITVFEEDDEARAIWRDEVGVRDERIVDMGAKDNYWSMGDVGPCGPCSEIFLDRGVEHACGDDCAIDRCDCDRWMEFWNLVFMQFEQREDGSRVALPKPSIDTGMGLERMCLILQGVDSVFEIDTLARIADDIGRLTGIPPSKGSEGTPHRVISDHVRSLSFAIADGAFPSNENRGFVLRRILRRAARYGYKLGMETPFIYELVDGLVDDMGQAFPDLVRQKPLVKRLIHKEEEAFLRTLSKGMASFDDEAERTRSSGSTVFSGQAAFFLHDTCGFPIDLTEQMAREQSLSVDRDEFERHMTEQKERSKADRAAARAAGGGGDDPWAGLPATEFTGYDVFTGEGTIIAHRATDDGIQLVLSSTPFYAEGGGEVGDTGELRGPGFTLRVVDTQKTADGVFVHLATIADGDAARIAEGVSVSAQVDVDRRHAIQRNHTATHLAHAALRRVLGTHVQQKGSLVEPERLRFDISHFDKITPEEIDRVEGLVASEILRDTGLEISILEREAAIAKGAMAFFGEKYGDHVRVVDIPGFSMELCGGAHVSRTGEIGAFVIVSEGSVSSGVRRIEAITGHAADSRNRENEAVLRALAADFKVSRGEVLERVRALMAENRELKKASKKSAPAAADLGALLAERGSKRDVGGCEVLSCSFESADMEEILTLADALKRRAGKRVFVLAGSSDGAVRFVVGHSQDVAKGTLHCGKIAGKGAKFLGGGGGGRPDMAQAGGKDVAKLPEAIALMVGEIENALAV